MPRHTKWGIWSPRFGLQVVPVDKWELRKDLSSVHFTTSTADEPPYTTSFEVDPNKLPPGYKVFFSCIGDFLFMFIDY